MNKNFKMKRAFNVKQKVFFTLSKKFLIMKIKPTVLKGESPTLNEIHHTKEYHFTDFLREVER